MKVFKKFLNFFATNSPKGKVEESKKDLPSSVHILIDYENLLPQNLDKISRNENSHIWLFVGSRQTKLNAGLIKAMQDFGDRAHQIYLEATQNQPNALDFILSYYLGYIAATYPQPHVAILSKDKGYEMVIDHARKNHNFLNITRYDNTDFVEKSTQQIPVNNKPLPHNPPREAQSFAVKTPLSPFSQSFRAAIIYLTDQEKYRPRMRERLENIFAKEIIMPIFSQIETDFSEEKALIQARKLVDQLQVSRLIEIEDKNVGLLSYHTDEESLYQRMKYFVLRKTPKHVVPLKELVAYNYSHRDIEEAEIIALIERLKREKVLTIVKGGHINYGDEVPSFDSYNFPELEQKVIEFIRRNHALPKNKIGLFNIIGTHTGTKKNEEALNELVNRLLKKKVFVINTDESITYNL